MIVGEGRDDAGAQFVGVGMGQFEGGHLFQMFVQQPGVVDETLQNQGLPSRHGAALAAQKRTCRKLGTRRPVWAAGKRWTRCRTSASGWSEPACGAAAAPPPA